MRFGLGYLGRTGNKKKLPPGQTFLRSQGHATVSFIAPAYTLLTAFGAAVTGLIGGTGSGATLLALTMTLDPATDSGVSSSDNITNNNTPNLIVTCPEGLATGDILTLRDLGSVIVSHTVTALEAAEASLSGSIPLSLTPLTDGVHSLDIKRTSGAAFSNFSTALVITVDTVAPVLTSPTGTKTGTSTATISVSTNTGVGTLYWIVDPSAVAPTAAQVQAGQNNSGAAAAASGNQAVSATGVQSHGVTGLNSASVYFTYFAHVDVAGNVSGVSSAASFTTDAPAGNPTILYQGSVFANLGSPTTPFFPAVPLGVASANRRALFCIQAADTIAADGAITAVTVNGSAANIVADLTGTGANPGFSGRICWVWADVPTGTTCDVDITGGNSNGSGPFRCHAYTLDKTQLNDVAPTFSSGHVGSGTADTFTLNTQANSFIIVATVWDFFGSASAPSITASTETYGTVDASNITSPAGTGEKTQIYSKKSAALASTPTSVTLGWTTASQSWSSILTWR